MRRLLHAWLLAAALSILTSGADATGATTCPCINPWAITGARALNDTGSLPGDGLLCAFRDTNGVCYPQSYGASECRPWDASATPACFNASAAPLWCALRWCYVDPLQCHRPHAASSLFPSATFGSDRLSLSYETCGNVDTSNAHGNINGEIQRLGPLRVSFPGDSGSGYTLVTVGENVTGVGGTRRDGSFPAFIGSLLADANVEWSEVPISPESYAAYPLSSFTACAHEVALNGTDLCAANLWDTEVRRTLAQFTRPLYDDEFRLVVFKESEGSSSSHYRYITVT